MADVDRCLVTKPNNFRQFEWARGKRLEQALVRLWIAMQIIFRESGVFVLREACSMKYRRFWSNNSVAADRTRTLAFKVPLHAVVRVPFVQLFNTCDGFRGCQILSTNVRDLQFSSPDSVWTHPNFQALYSNDLEQSRSSLRSNVGVFIANQLPTSPWSSFICSIWSMRLNTRPGLCPCLRWKNSVSTIRHV